MVLQKEGSNLAVRGEEKDQNVWADYFPGTNRREGPKSSPRPARLLYLVARCPSYL